MLDTAAKKDTAKLQRAIIDGLEDVKGQDIVVFDTEHLSSLFERVIIASGTSNRQTKGLASSVRDAVREENGEWIIVDCLQCVVHIMQPAIRTYYHLEEIWGDKPVRLKLGAAKPALATPAPVAAPVKKAAAKKSAPAKKAKKPERPIAGPRPEALPLTPAKKAAIKKAPAFKSPAAGTPAAKAPAKKAASAKLPVTVVGKVPVKKVAAKTSAKPAPAKRPRA
jgi:ribosome-associated protein